ncbi:MAG TPA: hypothetical protein VJP77_01255, partial [Planctomycetota bacterium]|nr:hypothetical protein [Planctomycetota bacterium]
WIISLLAVTLAAIGFGYIASDDLAREHAARVAAEADSTEAEASLEAAIGFGRALSQATGWYDRASANPRSDVDQLTRALDDFAAVFTEIDRALVKDLESALPIAQSMHRAAQDQVTKLQSDVARLESELAAERQARATALEAKDTELSGLRGQISDVEANAADREAELERRLAQANSRASDLDQDVRALRAEIDQQNRAFDQERKGLTAKLRDQAEKLGFTLPPARDLADGTVLSADPALGSAWIDIGANQRVARGVRFRVEGGTGSNRRTKGELEVTAVNANMAEARIVSQTDPFDPISRGDELVNPVFDPRGERNAVLIGRFSGRYSEDEVRALLERMGITVQDQVELTTDLLIVGADLFQDEFGEPLEEPISPTELPDYKEAESLGVSIVPLSRLREFFVLE